jgi:hypothetical protein
MPILIGPVGTTSSSSGAQPGRANAATNTTANAKNNTNLILFTFTSFYFIPRVSILHSGLSTPIGITSFATFPYCLN